MQVMNKDHTLRTRTPAVRLERAVLQPRDV